MQISDSAKINISENRTRPVARMLISLIMLILASGIVMQCGGKPTVQMYVSPEIQKTFAQTLEQGYDEAGAAQALRALSEKGDAYCENLLAGKIDTTFLKEKVNLPNKKLVNDLAFLTKVGCAGWYELTDRLPVKDFKRLSESAKLDGPIDCFSTGFLQPYIMIGALKCERLYITDISYRTQALHLDLIQKLFKKDYSFREFLAEQKFSFARSSRITKPLKQMNLTPDDICPEQNLKSCEETFVGLRKKVLGLKEIHLLLSPFHDFASHTYRKNSEKVMYLSNAIDPQFTTAEQFDTFMKDLAIFTAEKPVHLVYHMSGFTQFGIYAVGADSATKAVCADKFILPASEKMTLDPCGIPIKVKTKAEEFFTYLDKRAGLKQKPDSLACSR